MGVRGRRLQGFPCCPRLQWSFSFSCLEFGFLGPKGLWANLLDQGQSQRVIEGPLVLGPGWASMRIHSGLVRATTGLHGVVLALPCWAHLVLLVLVLVLVGVVLGGAPPSLATGCVVLMMLRLWTWSKGAPWEWLGPFLPFLG